MINGSADVIVTFNVADFPAEALAPFKIHTRHPDQFFLDLESLEEGAVIEAARADLAHYDNPPLSIDRYLDDLCNAGVPKTAEYLSQFRILLT